MTNESEHKIAAALREAYSAPSQPATVQQDVRSQPKAGQKRKRSSKSAAIKDAVRPQQQASAHGAKQGLAAQHAAVIQGNALQGGTPLNHNHPNRGFSVKDPMMDELLSWISCSAILSSVAASVAVASCCQALARSISSKPHAQALPPPPPSSSSSSSSEDSSDELDDHLAQYEIDLEAAETLQKVLNNAEANGRSSSQSLLPALKRRNSGKRNLRRPWTNSEEDQLVRLIDQADYRKQVLNVSRLTKGGWGKIAHHLGRSGSSAVSALKLKYKTLKEQPVSQPPMRQPVVKQPAPLSGPASIPQPVRSPFHSPAAVTAANNSDPSRAEGPQDRSTPIAAAASAEPQSKSSSKRKQYTGCALAIMGLQHLPGKQGTGKQIVDSIAASSELGQHLNWDVDQSGKVRWQNAVTCALSACKSGIFRKTGRKQGRQVVWQLDDFKAQLEMKRHENMDSTPA